MVLKKLFLLGVGKTAFAVKKFATGYEQVIGTTRSVDKIASLREAGIEPILLKAQGDDIKITDYLTETLSGADVVVSYPPDSATDNKFSDLAERAAKIIYVSSTGVYGKLHGKIDEDSPIDEASPSSAARLRAEQVWRNKGAVVLRAAGLYSQDSGLLTRLRAGNYRIPGDGLRYVSRIHIDDLARIILAALAKAEPASTYVVADRRPSTHLEVALWLCRKFKLPIPNTMPIDEVHETLRGNRQICADKVLRELEVDLLYPSFIEGYGG